MLQNYLVVAEVLLKQRAYALLLKNLMVLNSILLLQDTCNVIKMNNIIKVSDIMKYLLMFQFSIPC